MATEIADRQQGRITREQLLGSTSRRGPRRAGSRGCATAWVRTRCGADKVEACIARNPHKPGATKLRNALGSDVTLSELEERFVALLAEDGLTGTAHEHRPQRRQLDCHWPH